MSYPQDAVGSDSPHDSARGSPEPDKDGFLQAVARINAVLGPSDGIDSENVDVAKLEEAMAEYTSLEEDWQKYAFADASRGYTRNLVDRGNGKSNLLVLVWTPGKGSPIHDHANSHCVMKILKGSLEETLYAWPCASSSGSTSGAPGLAVCSTEDSCSKRGGHAGLHALNVRRITQYNKDEVTYMSDKLGLHRIRNPSATDYAVSLHLYTPPNAAKHGCHVFDEISGRKAHVSQCHFYSELGVKT